MAKICSQKWHKNHHKLVKNSCIYIISSVFESINVRVISYIHAKKIFLKYLCIYFHIFAEIEMMRNEIIGQHFETVFFFGGGQGIFYFFGKWVVYI